MNELEKLYIKILTDNRNRIMRICKSYSISLEDSKDLFQDVVFNIWKSLPGFKQKSDINTWIYRITINVCIRNSMKLKKIRVRQFDRIGIEYKLSVEPNQQTIIEKHERVNQLYSCISKLNNIDRNIALLFLEDLSIAQISDILGTTANNVSVRLHRLKKELFICMKEVEK